jgi:hypothetical protein
VVELAAQRMRGWSAEGEPFRKLLNQNIMPVSRHAPSGSARNESLRRRRMLDAILSEVNRRAFCEMEC